MGRIVAGCLFGALFLSLPFLSDRVGQCVGSGTAWGYIPVGSCDGPAPLDDSSPIGAEAAIHRRAYASGYDYDFDTGAGTYFYVAVGQSAGTSDAESPAGGPVWLWYGYTKWVYDEDGNYQPLFDCAGYLEGAAVYEADCMGSASVSASTPSGQVEIAWTPVAGGTLVQNAAAAEDAESPFAIAGGAAGVAYETGVSGTVCGQNIAAVANRVGDTNCSVGACARVGNP